MGNAHDQHLHALATRNDVEDKGEYEAIVKVEVPITVNADNPALAESEVWKAIAADYPSLDGLAGEITSLTKDGTNF